jgi:hypothetical protein
MRKIIRDRLLLAILFVGLLARLVFLLVGAHVYYANSQADIFTNGDTHSYVLAFTNLLEQGIYTFDFLEPDAAFGRLPGYPFFYGLHYLIFGSQHAAMAVACTQVLLDTLAALLMFLALRSIWSTARWTPYIGAALYALYPFTIIWVTIIGTETLATFLVLLWLNYLMRMRTAFWSTVGLGLLVAVAFYVREYLGVLLPISLVYLAVKYYRTTHPTWLKTTAQAVILASLGFGVLYVAWPIRNYLSYHRLVWIKPPTAGYANYNIDFASFRSWVHCWTNDEQLWLDKVAKGTGNFDFPAIAFTTPAERQQANYLANQARHCGSSFYLYRTGLYSSAQYRNVALMRANKEYQNNCNVEVSTGFDQLKTEFIRRHPVRYWMQVPIQNLSKAFFKSSANRINGGAKQLLISGLFAYRTFLLLLAVIGISLSYHRLGILPVVLYFSFMYLFISFIMRNMEMRYLLQADVMSLILTASALGYWFDRSQYAAFRKQKLASV